jgi:hypothetical protein
MVQDVSAGLASEPDRPTQAITEVQAATGGAPVPLPRVHGGSKWAHLYGGPKRAALRAVESVLHVNALCLPDGTIATTPPDAGAPQEVFADTAFPLAAGPAIPLGQFLTAQLPGILMQRATWETGRVACVPPTPPQREVLRRLGLLDNHVSLSQPVRFRLAVGQAPAMPGPGGAVLDLFARLRAAPAGTARRLAILPPREREVFTLRNRASLTAWLRARRITILDPDALGFDALAATLADASLLILADPAQAGLIGLCGAATKILEVAPEGFAGGAARAICGTLALDWVLLLGTPPAYPLLQPLAFGARVPLAYEIPISGLNAILASLER